jgi:acetoin utilization deacetylase AcuC-like enzyme
VPLLVVTHPAVQRHDPPHEVGLGRIVSPRPERAGRLDALLAACADAGLATTGAAAHDEDLLRSVHDPDLVDWLRDGWAAWRAAGGPEVLVPDTFAHRAWPGARPPSSPIGAAGWWLMDTATPIVEGSWAAARAAVDIALTAVDLVVDAGHAAVHGATRPPGHHAGRAYAGGFCLVNHAAIAAEALTLRTGGRVAVLDIDHHHGNGTQEVFWEREDVSYVSLHADPAGAYPWFSGHRDEVGAGPGRGTTHNHPLPPGTDDATYLRSLADACATIASSGVEALVVSLGVDTADTDPVGGLGLSPAAYAGIGAMVGALGLPTVSLQEGGYDLARLGPDTVAVLTGLG